MSWQFFFFFFACHWARHRLESNSNSNVNFRVIPFYIIIAQVFELVCDV